MVIIDVLLMSYYPMIECFLFKFSFILIFFPFTIFVIDFICILLTYSSLALYMLIINVIELFS